MVPVYVGRKMRTRENGRSSGLVIRFAAACLLVFLAVGVAAHVVVRRQVRNEDQSNAQSKAVLVTNSLLVPLLHGVDLRAPLSLSVAASLREDMRPLFVAKVERIKIWRSDGTIVFSDEPRLIGKRFDANDDFAATALGPHSEITNLSDPENAFERGLAPSMFSTYLRLPGDTAFMIELYQDYRPTQAAINHTVGQLDLALVSALLLLYLIVLPISARTSRSLRASNEALSSTNEALKAREEQLSSSLERERSATERLRSLDDLKNMILTSVSHEMRTPLTSILGFASTLQRHHSELDPPLQREIAQRIKDQSERLQRLLGDLLDVDRLERGILETRRRPTDVGELIRRVVREADIQDRTVHVNVDDFRASLDAAKVERILENLLSNAAKHTPPGTTIVIQAAAIEQGMLLVVEDDGPGVLPEIREGIFQPLAQGTQRSPHSPGTGVGLALVAGFAELHGGRAWVEERPGGGASFKVLLAVEPLGDAGAAAAS
jgi:signal transduction histidine kinase